MSMSETVDCGTIRYDRANETYSVKHGWGCNVPFGELIVKTISKITNTNVLELQPLYETIDPEALDDLFSPVEGKAPRNVGSLTFEYEGYQIVVHASGWIDIIGVDNSHI